MPPDTMFEIGGPNIVWDVFQDEVVVINLDRGRYYALDPIGGVLFDLLVKGAAMSAIARTTARPPVDRGSCFVGPRAE